MHNLPTVLPDDIRKAAYGARIPAGDAIDDQLEVLIGKAGRELVSRVPNLDARLMSGAIVVDDVRDVIEAMVVRVVRNPSGYRQIGLDDFQATIDNALSAGGLYVSDDERDKLGGKRRPARFRSARVAVPAWRLP